jgi:hypothetical protein
LRQIIGLKGRAALVLQLAVSLYLPYTFAHGRSHVIEESSGKAA